MHKTPNVFPIIGQRKSSHLTSNIESLRIQLTHSDLKTIDAAKDFDPGFPMSFIFGDGFDVTMNTAADVELTRLAAEIDAPPLGMPVRNRMEV